MRELVLALAAALALGGSFAAPIRIGGQAAPTVGIDMDIAGNNDSTIGAIQNCAEIARVGDTLTFDLFVKNVDPAVRIQGYQFDIDYDPKVIRINSVVDFDPAGSTPPNNVSIITRIPSGGGAGFLTLTEGPLPDTDGSFTVAVIDGTGNPSPPDNHEAGEGVLARVTIEAVGTGRSNLIIPGPRGGPDGNPDMIILSGATEEVAIGQLLNGAVSVDTACTPPPSPLPATDGGTQPGTPADGPATGTGVADGGTQGAQTPGAGGPSTPTLGGTPIFDSTPTGRGDAQTAGDGDGGGLSTAAWIGIAVGIVAAVLAAGGGGWFAYQHRKAGPQ